VLAIDDEFWVGRLDPGINYKNLHFDGKNLLNECLRIVKCQSSDLIHVLEYFLKWIHLEAAQHCKARESQVKMSNDTFG
jgi:hypothetical protein